MSPLEFTFSGQFQVVWQGIPLTGFRSDKIRALLAYLAVEAGIPHRREALATLLWRPGQSGGNFQTQDSSLGQ